MVWARPGGEASGKLEARAGGFELHGRAGSLTVPFADVLAASIGRGGDDRLHGLPVLVLLRGSGETLRIASLDGPGALLELADLVGAA